MDDFLECCLLAIVGGVVIGTLLAMGIGCIWAFAEIILGLF